jgi:hypothetical protein
MFRDRHFRLSGRWHRAVSTDVTAPTISTGPTVSAKTDTTATVAWTLGEAGTGQVGYGLVDPAGTTGSLSIVDSDLLTGSSQYVTVPKSSVSFTTDDVVVIFMGKPLAGSLFSAVAPTTGWTLHGNEKYTTAGNTMQIVVAVKRITAPGSEPISWEFDRGSEGTPEWSAITLVLRGVDLTDIADAVLVYVSGANDFTPDAPDITTVTNGALVLTGHYTQSSGADRSTATAGAPSGMTLLGRAAQIKSFAALAYKVEATAGAKVYGAWTHTPDNATDDFQTWTIAIRPAVGGGVSSARVVDYDAQSAHEGRLLTSHSQALSGLAPSTTYHYMVESADAADNVVKSTDATFATLVAGGGGGTPGGFPTSQTGVTYVAWGGSLSEPGYLVEVADPNFEGSITRVTPDGQTWRNLYPRQPAWNADGSRLAFPGYGNRLLHGVTYADLGVMTGMPSSLSTWSMIDATLMWVSSTSDNKLWRYYPDSSTLVLHRTFAGYATANHGNYEGRPDKNDRYFAMLATGGVLLVYDAIADTIVGTATLPSSNIDWTGMSVNGDYAIVDFNTTGSGMGQGTWLYTRGGQPVRNIFPSGHGDAALDAAGNDIYVGLKNSKVVAHRLSTGQEFDVAFGNFQNGHISGTGVGRPGWVVLSQNVVFSGNPTPAGYDQIVSARVDGSLETQVWCHARTIQTNAQYSYDWSTHAVSSRDGTKVCWGGGWERATTGTSNRRSYVVRIAPAG